MALLFIFIMECLDDDRLVRNLSHIGSEREHAHYRKLVGLGATMSNVHWSSVAPSLSPSGTDADGEEVQGSDFGSSNDAAGSLSLDAGGSEAFVLRGRSSRGLRNESPIRSEVSTGLRHRRDERYLADRVSISPTRKHAATQVNTELLEDAKKFRKCAIFADLSEECWRDIVATFKVRHFTQYTQMNVMLTSHMVHTASAVCMWRGYLQCWYA